MKYILSKFFPLYSKIRYKFHQHNTCYGLIVINYNFQSTKRFCNIPQTELLGKAFEMKEGEKTLFHASILYFIMNM